MHRVFQAEVKEAQRELNKQKDLLKECNKDITDKMREHKELNKELYDVDLKITESDHKVAKCNKDAKEADKTVGFLLENNFNLVKNNMLSLQAHSTNANGRSTFRWSTC